jgi:hypothetical protein
MYLKLTSSEIIHCFKLKWFPPSLIALAFSRTLYKCDQLRAIEKSVLSELSPESVTLLESLSSYALRIYTVPKSVMKTLSHATYAYSLPYLI